MTGDDSLFQVVCHDFPSHFFKCITERGRSEERRMVPRSRSSRYLSTRVTYNNVGCVSPEEFWDFVGSFTIATASDAIRFSDHIWIIEEMVRQVLSFTGALVPWTLPSLKEEFQFVCAAMTMTPVPFQSGIGDRLMTAPEQAEGGS